MGGLGRSRNGGWRFVDQCRRRATQQIVGEEIAALVAGGGVGYGTTPPTISCRRAGRHRVIEVEHACAHRVASGLTHERMSPASGPGGSVSSGQAASEWRGRGSEGLPKLQRTTEKTFRTSAADYRSRAGRLSAPSAGPRIRSALAGAGGIRGAIAVSCSFHFVMALVGNGVVERGSNSLGSDGPTFRSRPSANDGQSPTCKHAISHKCRGTSIANGGSSMTEHGADQDKPISDSLHPLVHVAIIGLVLMFVAAMDVLRQRPLQVWLDVVVTGLFVIAISSLRSVAELAPEHRR